MITDKTTKHVIEWETHPCTGYNQAIWITEEFYSIKNYIDKKRWLVKNNIRFYDLSE